MRWFYALPLVAAFTGCATWGQMDSGLQSLNGKNIQEAVAVLGYPSSDGAVAGMRLVTWSTSSSSVMLMPQTATTTGNIYGSYGTASYSQNTFGTAVVPMNGDCRITLQVDDANIIRGHQYDGNMLGCERYIKALNRAFKATATGTSTNTGQLPKGGNS